MFLPVTLYINLSLPLAELVRPRRALLPRRLPGLSLINKMLPNGAIVEENVQIAVQVCASTLFACLVVSVCTLDAQVVRARNIPYRRVSESTFSDTTVTAPPSPSRSPRRSQGIVTTGTAPVVSFVQLTFQEGSVRTTAHSGTAPQWNEVLALPFKSPGGDYSPATLSTLPDMVNIAVFDEVTTTFVTDDRDKHTTYTQSEHRYLGSVSIPFTTLYHSGSIEGEFRLNAPMASLAYLTKKESGATTTTSRGYASPSRALPGDEEGLGITGAMQSLDLVDSSRDAHIYVSLTLTPALAPPEVSGGESNVRPRAPDVDPSIMDHAKAWEVKYTSKLKPIKVLAFYLHLNDRQQRSLLSLHRCLPRTPKATTSSCTGSCPRWTFLPTCSPCCPAQRLTGH